MSFRRVSAVVLVSFFVACGARTGLREPPPEPMADAGDAAPDAPADAPADISIIDAPLDAVEEDAPEDVAPDVTKEDCVDASITYIYVVTTDFRLLSFRPAVSRFASIGRLDCPNAGNTTPFSMAVDRKGTAYVLYSDGRLFKVSTLDASCSATPYVPGQLGYTLFGMGFATDQGGPSETLYIASSTDFGNSRSALGSIDPDTFQVSDVGDFVPTLGGAELTGTGDGRLFGLVASGINSNLVQIDKSNANVLSSTVLAGIDTGSGFAFAFWGGAFYTFTAPQQMRTQVNRFDPNDGSVRRVASLGSVVVGAGVSTCAPEKPEP